MSSQQAQQIPKLSQNSGVTKKKQPAIKRRADKKRAERVSSAVHIATVANALANRTRKQSQRWLQHTYNNSNRSKYNKEARAKASHWLAHRGEGQLSPAATKLLNRLEDERKAARLAAGVEEGGWVEDWFGDEGGRKPKQKAKKTTEEAHREEADDEESDDGGVPVVSGRIFLSPEPEVEEEVMDEIA